MQEFFNAKGIESNHSIVLFSLLISFSVWRIRLLCCRMPAIVQFCGKSYFFNVSKFATFFKCISNKKYLARFGVVLTKLTDGTWTIWNNIWLNIYRRSHTELVTFKTHIFFSSSIYSLYRSHTESHRQHHQWWFITDGWWKVFLKKWKAKTKLFQIWWKTGNRNNTNTSSLLRYLHFQCMPTFADTSIKHTRKQ